MNSTPERTAPLRRPSKESMRNFLAFAGIAVGVVGIGAIVEATTPSAPASPAPIVRLAGNHPSTNLPTYKVTIEQGGDVSQVVDDFTAAEGFTPNDAIQNRENKDSHAIADAVSQVPGGDVQAGTTFEAQAENPIIFPQALKHDPSAIIQQVNSDSK